MKEVIKYIIIGCLAILALFHTYYNGSDVWECLYFSIEYVGISVLLLYITYVFRRLLKGLKVEIEKGEPLFFGISSLYFIFKVWYNINFYYPMFGLDVSDVQKWAKVATWIVICILFSLQASIYIKYVKKR
jgi:hypothetical protein